MGGGGGVRGGEDLGRGRKGGEEERGSEWRLRGGVYCLTIRSKTCNT